MELKLPEKLSDVCVGCRRVMDISKAPPDIVGETLCTECFPDSKVEYRFPIKNKS